MTVVRCPRCGSTDAGATDYLFEITRMTCRACGHETMSNDEEIDRDWIAPVDAVDAGGTQPTATPLRCPWCDSPDVGEDPGRAENHYTFLACRRCGRGESIDSLTAASRWKAGPGDGGPRGRS